MCGTNKTKKLTISNQRGSELKGKKNIFVLVRIALGTSQVKCIRNSGVTVKSANLQSDIDLNNDIILELRRIFPDEICECERAKNVVKIPIDRGHDKHRYR